jgi:DNA-directed RNA polymerase specialized sigma24 family protein
VATSLNTDTRDDQTLVAAAVSGYQGAFEVLHGRYDAHAHRVARQAARNDRERDFEDDAVQVVWLWLLAGRWRLDEHQQGDLTRFITALTKYALWRVSAERGDRVSLSEPDDDTAGWDPAWLRALDPTPEELLLLRQEREREHDQHLVIRATISGWPPKWRELIRLRYVVGLRHCDIAGQVRRSPEAVGNTLSNLRVKLAAALCYPIDRLPVDMTFRTARAQQRPTNKQNYNARRRRERRREVA